MIAPKLPTNLLMHEEMIIRFKKVFDEKRNQKAVPKIPK